MADDRSRSFYPGDSGFKLLRRPVGRFGR